MYGGSVQLGHSSRRRAAVRPAGRAGSGVFQERWRHAACNSRPPNKVVGCGKQRAASPVATEASPQLSDEVVGRTK